MAVAIVTIIHHAVCLAESSSTLYDNAVSTAQILYKPSQTVKSVFNSLELTFVSFEHGCGPLDKFLTR